MASRTKERQGERRVLHLVHDLEAAGIVPWLLELARQQAGIRRGGAATRCGVAGSGGATRAAGPPFGAMGGGAETSNSAMKVSDRRGSQAALVALGRRVAACERKHHHSALYSRGLRLS